MAFNANGKGNRDVTPSVGNRIMPVLQAAQTMQKNKAPAKQTPMFNGRQIKGSTAENNHKKPMNNAMIGAAQRRLAKMGHDAQKK